MNIAKPKKGSTVVFFGLGAVGLAGWGVAVLVGVPHKDAVFKTHPVNFLSEKTLTGIFFGNYNPKSDLPAVVERYVNKEIEVEKFINHRVPLSMINKAFEYMLKGESLRCIIYIDEEE